ncbi:MAG: putative toxin-antitoxin system toxin component, PIN family [Rhodocyclales bacterium CG17_big_fil_post_rev_8_21_14_2_50_68_7]|nr:MAG: putative toxin-antitoxin system toxin component, PIN family [Betaproteobacteria bacterium CG2_30_68_42]PIV75198.1 MAG: putative toxin-antitoxin system toxin component, PIN family [Rhodocyclales bacterium CG17_big_fil_post_rev_8_21_14_2_50_68_7]PIX76288.1 MAG: putative toxin-antitoxin system toxin component, PIN family [Rhodocyclales bacterium CG_4_10_14_3_um_filter_68_10]PJA57055.1 MAG: putative toxin-antitoxin system toxin component, PIN family [Rhodocyclales bacterium CG_4_9_14_3_um_fi
MRAVLDTNVVVSALLFRAGRRDWLRAAWQRGRLVALVTRETTGELLRVLEYPKFRLSPEDRRELLADFLPHAEIVAPAKKLAKLPACRDPADTMFLHAAAAGRAEALVTGDEDLLALARLTDFAILSPGALRQRLGA